LDALDRLQEALNEEDPALAAEAIRLGADVNATWEEEVLLTTATQLAAVDILKLLLEAGADPNRKNVDGTTPLTWCSSSERIELLLDAGASARYELHRPLFHSSLHGAAEAGDVARLRLLLDRGEAACLLPEFDEMLSWTPLHCAVHEGHRDAARLLIEAGANPNHFDDDLGDTAISLAAERSNVEMVRLLLELGADPALQVGLNASALDYARRPGATPELLACIEAALSSKKRAPGR
jgi:ankyrin repeat protein